VVHPAHHLTAERVGRSGRVVAPHAAPPVPARGPAAWSIRRTI